ncbi:MAG: SIS domain-containing protein [Clostridiales Family XIII bacterium]|jgi:DNA-binding MurR/RpiR family transcriptional regulator|nr:SIS domain-containing protein [Clostridiales Family XIII bacterium]
MVHIDYSKLNKTECEINETLNIASQSEENINIMRAAELCGCSTSKISKFVKKLGFTNYKNYRRFLYNEEMERLTVSSELERIRTFLDNFDVTLVDQFIELIHGYDKIIFFGYGPSFYCAEYFEYKLRIATNKTCMAVPDDISAESMLDDNSLLVIFSTTGRFKSFTNLYAHAKEKGAECLMITEEYNLDLINEFEKIFVLTNSTQGDELSPYEKSRITFFIFIEEVILKIQREKKYEKANIVG